MDQRSQALQESYNRVAREYTERIADELAHKPLDRALLERFAAEMRGRGAVYDLGCGPGHVARYLHAQGVQVTGLDLSDEMVAQARGLNPEMSFEQGDMRTLPLADHALAGITAFYSIIHVPRDQVTAALAEWRRVLQPGGALLLAFHIGSEVVHMDEWWQQPVNLDFAFFGTDEMQGYLEAADLVVDEVVERAPYADVEHPSRRAYVFAHRPE